MFKEQVENIANAFIPDAAASPAKAPLTVEDILKIPKSSTTKKKTKRLTPMIPHCVSSEDFREARNQGEKAKLLRKTMREENKRKKDEEKAMKKRKKELDKLARQKKKAEENERKQRQREEMKQRKELTRARRDSSSSMEEDKMMESQILMDMASDDDDDVDQLIMEVMVSFYGSSVKFAMPGGTNIVQRLRSHSAPKRWSGCSFGATNVSHKIRYLTMTTITTMMMFDEND